MNSTENIEVDKVYAIDGICDIKVSSGVISIHGARLFPSNDWFRVSQYLWDRPWSITSEEGAIVETSPVNTIYGTPNHSLRESNNTIRISDNWKKTYFDIISSNINLLSISVKGPRNSGKSTFVRYLLNSLLTNSQLTDCNKGIYFLETDIGQPELSLPGQISLYLLHKPLLETSHAMINLVPIKSVFYGDVSLADDPDAFLRGVAKVLSATPLNRDIPLVVNTSGWDTGFGAQMTFAIEKLAKVNVRVHMGLNGPSFGVLEKEYNLGCYSSTLNELLLSSEGKYLITDGLREEGKVISYNIETASDCVNLSGGSDQLSSEQAPTARANRTMRILNAFNPLFSSSIHFFPSQVTHENLFGVTLQEFLNQSHTYELKKLIKREQRDGSSIDCQTLSVTLDARQLIMGVIGQQVKSEHFDIAFTGQVVGMCNSGLVFHDEISRESVFKGDKIIRFDDLPVLNGVSKQSMECLGYGYVRGLDIATGLMQVVLSTNFDLTRMEEVDSVILGHYNLQTILKHEAITKKWTQFEGKPAWQTVYFLQEGLVSNIPYMDMGGLSVNTTAGRVMTARKKGVERAPWRGKQRVNNNRND